jgi:hypothetical protein
MLWIGQHLLGGADLDDAAQVHHRDPVGDVPGQPQVVVTTSTDRPRLLAQPEQQREDLAADRGVQRRDRLVGDEDAWLQRQGAGDHHPCRCPPDSSCG